MIREIDMSPDTSPERITMMLAGASRSGKTHFAATFPRPVFISDLTEGGHMTIKHMMADDFYEPDRPPRVFGVTDAKEMMETVTHVEELFKQNPDEIQTLVLDSLTFYAEMMFSDLEAASGNRDKRQLYGDLASHLRYLMIRLHKLPVNIVWLALAKEGGEDHALGGISIPGQTATKAPARCDIWAYIEQIEKRKERIFRTHFQTYAGFKAGHRFGDLLPPMMEDANYRSLEQALELEPWTNRLTKKTQPKKAPKKAS